MPPLSPHYRTDDPDGIDSKIKDYLDATFLKHLVNIERRNPKLLVVFSGGNAMGKTTIANKISDTHGGLVLENDAVKRQLKEYIPDADRDSLNRFTWQYTMDLYGRLDGLTANGLVVRDGVIDWYFDRILPIFERAGYPIFIIGFELSREKTIELIKKRGDTPTVSEERFYELLDDHAIHTRRFREIYTPDVLLTDANVFDHDFVLKKLGERLATLPQPASASDHA
jgi:predicted kinase